MVKTHPDEERAEQVMTDYGTSPAIDPARAETVLEPPGAGEGHWVGAPSALVHDGNTYLAVRERTPDARGRAVVVYRRQDGRFVEINRITADALGVESVERPALVSDPGTGDVKLYLPVDHGENDWTIEKVDDVPTPEAFDPVSARDVLVPEPGSSDCETVKDPYVLTVGGLYFLYYAGHDGRSEQAHLATSADGETWIRSDENPLLPRDGWHDHHTRIARVVPAPDAPVWLVFYEGSNTQDYGETWNLRTGIGITSDLETIVDASPSGPRISSHGPGGGIGIDRFATCRYLDLIEREDEWEVFVEVARQDGAFELRRQVVPLERTQ